MIVAVVAVAGLAAGASGAGASSTRPHAVLATSDVTLVNARNLLSLIPSDVRDTCFRVDPMHVPTGPTDVIAAIECHAPADGVDSVLYLKYSSADTLASDFTGSYPGDLPPASAYAPTCDGTRDWDYSGIPAGTYACFTSDSTPTVVWTATLPEVLGIATGSDATTLMTWWTNSAGPSDKSADVTDFASDSKAARKKAAKTLIAGSGGSLTNCESKLGGIRPGDAEWAFSPWISAAQSCDAPDHGSVYLAQLAPGAAETYALYFVNNVIIGDSNATKPSGCTEQNITNNKKKVVGALNCVLVGKKLYATWYTTDDGVMGVAQVNTAPKKLFAYLNQHKLL